MVAVATGGGGNLAVDHHALAHAAVRLSDVAVALDRCGDDTPHGNTGDAAVLVATVLAAFSDVGAQLVAEASIIGAAVESCSAGLASVDADQAVAVLGTGTH